MELIYHYLWYHKMFGRHLTATDGSAIEVVHPGMHNDDAGPDFSNARLKINDNLWAGNVEIHIKASDWFRHSHHLDPAYNNVILHVVANDDTTVKLEDGRIPLQVAVDVPDHFFVTFHALVNDMKGIRCSQSLNTLPDLIALDWLESLGVERLHAKARRLLDYNSQLGGDWEQATFTLLARAMGFGLNGVPFEILAKNLPLRILYHHADDLLLTEALLFGQAGMLDSSNHIFDEYYQALCREYAFLARKYSLRPGQKSLWKYAKTRPQNFPHRRIAYLAQAIHEGVRFSSEIIEAKGNPDLLSKIFSWRLSGYWVDHYSFGEMDKSTSSAASLSMASKRLLMINVSAPFYIAYAKISNNYDAAEYAVQLLSSLPAERNTKIKMWESYGIIPDNALHSQALLHLQENYCNCNKCLNCRFGHHFLRREATNEYSGILQNFEVG